MKMVAGDSFPISFYTLLFPKSGTLPPLGVLSLLDQVAGVYKQTSPPAHATITRKNGTENVFTWRNKAGVKWDLILDTEDSESPNCFKNRSWPTLPCPESGEVVKFKVRE